MRQGELYRGLGIDGFFLQPGGYGCVNLIVLDNLQHFCPNRRQLFRAPIRSAFLKTANRGATGLVSGERYLMMFSPRHTSGI